MKLRSAVIVDGLRTAFARGGRGRLEATRMDEAAAFVIREIFQRNPKVKPAMIEDFGIGNWGYQRDIAGLNNISRLAGLPAETANFLSNRQCASSQETFHRLAMSIMLGACDCGLSVGVERMDRQVVASRESGPSVTRVTSPNLNLMKPDKLQRDMAYNHFDYFSTPVPDEILDSPMASMVQTAQNVADMYDLTREELDEFSMKSQRRLGAAADAGLYKDEIVPLEIEDPVFNENGQWVEEERGPMITFDRDESIRPRITMEDLGRLAPIRGIISYTGDEVKITAGNSCPVSTGASVILVMSEDLALKLGLEPLARLVGWGNAGVKQQIMGLGPVPATVKALKHAGLDIGQIDRIEFNEAFAAQVIPCLRELKIDPSIVNVNGGSIGIGHPLGATGGRLIMTVAKELRRSKKRYGLATQCVSAGQGTTTILEALD